MDTILQYIPLLLIFFLSTAVMEVIILRFRRDDKLVFRLALTFSIILFLWILSDIFLFFSYNKEVIIFFDAIGKAIALFIEPVVFLFLLTLFKNRKYFNKISVFFVFFPPVVLFFLYIFSAFTKSYGDAEVISNFFFFGLIIIYSILIVIFSIMGSSEKLWKVKTCEESILLAFSGVIPALSIGIREYYQIYNFRINEVLINNLPYMGMFLASSILIYLVLRCEFADRKITKGFTTDEIIDAIDEYILVTDEEKNIALINGTLLDRLDYSENEVINYKLNKILNISEKNIESLNYVKDEFLDCEGEIKSKNKKKYKVAIRISKILDRDNDLIGYIFNMRDLQELINLQKDINKSKRELEKEKNDFKFIRKINENREDKLRELKEEYKKYKK